MIKRALIIVSIILAGVIGYTVAYQQLPQLEPAPSQQAVDIPDTQQLPEPPKVFEKDVQSIWSTLLFSKTPEGRDFIASIREAGTLRFDLEAGNRVEGEVTVLAYNEDGITTIVQDRVFVFGFIKDPNGNIILRTSAVGEIPAEQSWTQRTQHYPTQIYPWRFSFIAATSGEFSLEVNTGRWETHPTYGAHLKVTVYEK